MSHFKIQKTDTYQAKNNLNYYDMDKCMEYILERGKKMYGEHFVINKSQREVYKKLLFYGLEDLQNLRELDLNKGLLLMGESGCGKTAMMHLSKTFFIPKKRFEIKSCRALSQEFSHRGFEATTTLFDKNTKPICLDNLGKETTAKHYGYSCDVVYNIIEYQYEQRFNQNIPKLHITTSLSPKEIENRYGISFRKMLQEMFNVVVCE